MGHLARNRLRHFIYPSINARITGPFLLIVIVMAGIGVFIVTYLVAGSLEERFNNQLLDSARAATNSLVDIEREQLATLRLMVFTEGVSDAITAGDAERLDVWLRPVATNAQVDDVIVFDQTGQGVFELARVSSSPLEYASPSPPNMAHWSGVQGVLTTRVDGLGDKYIDIIETPPDILFYITAPVKNADGQVVGGISIGMRLQRLVQLISEQSLSAVALYDQNGTVLGSTFRLIVPARLSLSPQQIQELAARAEHSTPIDDLDLDGAPYQVLYAPFYLRSQPVGLIAVGLPTNFIVERISTSRNTFGMLFAVLFITVSGFGLLITRTITRPIKRLVDTTSAIREGDLSRRVELHTPDELGELATSFDHMTAQLVKRNAQVEALYRQQLRETAQREAVLANIGDAVFVQDLAGNIILSNRAATELLREIRQDAQDKRKFAQITRQPEIVDRPQMFDLAGEHFSVLAKPVHLPSGKLLGHVIVFRDITALVRSERLKDELILQMSHELRTPLTAARGYADLIRMLEQSHLSSQGRTFIQGTVDSLTILERMINQVIDVSAIISNRFTVDARRLNLAAVIPACAEHWADLAQQRSLKLTVSVPSKEMWIEGDEHYLSQALDHLVRNACNYTLPGGSVEVCAAQKNSHVLIYVIDSGVGIPPDELDKVFDRMYRGSSAEAGPTDTRGLGLGLYLSKHIVEAHHGAIHLDSKVNFGTAVTVELPVGQNGTCE